MLYANINPTAKTIQQIDPFTTSQKESPYMTVIAKPYGAGAIEVLFEVVFGNMVTDISGLVGFYKDFSIETNLTSTELEPWASDDSVLLSLIATKLGTTASNFVNTILGDQLI